MSACVLDGSVALSWVLPDETAEPAAALLERIVEQQAVVPNLWHLEVANVLRAAERRGRITTAERARALAILASLPISVDARTAGLAFNAISDLATQYDLTVYDAAYLELALRTGLPLASLDRALRAAAIAAGVALAV